MRNLRDNESDYMIVAVLLGVIAGLVGFVPLVVGLRLTRRTVSAGVAGSMMVLLLGLLVSFILLFLGAVLFIAYDKSLAFPFVLAEVIALCAVAIGYGVAKMVRK